MTFEYINELNKLIIRQTEINSNPEFEKQEDVIMDETEDEEAAEL